MTDRIPDGVLDEHWFYFMQKLAENLQQAFRTARDKRGVKQQDIADRLGKSAGYVSRCLSGQQNMTMRSMHNLARAMGYRIEVRLQDLGELAPANRPSAIGNREQTTGSTRPPAVFEIPASAAG